MKPVCAAAEGADKATSEGLTLVQEFMIREFSPWVKDAEGADKCLSYEAHFNP